MTAVALRQPHVASIDVRTDVLPRAWDAYVTSRADGSIYHLAAWRGIVERTFRHKTTYLAACADGEVVGVLPLVRFDTALFGRFMASMPFVNYGGVLASSTEAAEALLGRAVEEAEAAKASYLELRHTTRMFGQLAVKEHKVGMTLPLQPTVDDQWKVLDRKLRNQVRKAEKSGLTTKVGGLELLDGFHDVMSRNMRDLGSPVHSKRFYREILSTFPDTTRLLTVCLGDRPIAASFVVWHGQQIEVPWASAIREFNSLCPNVLLYWEMLKFSIESGFARFDFGRSTPNEGTFHFKQQWGAEPQPLFWEYWLSGGTALPDRSPKNAKFSTAISMWQRLPVAVTRVLGPAIVRNIP